MPVQKFITTEKLVEYLDQESSDLLLSHDVYDIGNYGWQSEDTEDPDYIGHAMWQINPPVETEWDYLFGAGPVRCRPTEKEKLLTVAGYDFEGLMRASRMSIGLCLLHKSIAMQKPLDDNHYFWLHYTDSIFQLNMASDRIREYFVVAFFDETSKTYKDKGKKNNWYVTPFIQTRNHCQENQIKLNITNAVMPLPDIADKIYSFRESRNEIVHDISTKLGKMHKELIERQQQAYDAVDTTETSNNMLDYDAMLQRQKEINEEHEKELSASSSIIIEWYTTLVKFSSHIFEAEHWLRKSKGNA